MAARNRVFVAVAVVVVVGAVAAGLVMLGPPAEERARRLDERRVTDLLAISQLVDRYRTRHDALPATMDDLAREAGDLPRDPVTEMPYDYRMISETTYEVCATFDRQSEPGERNRTEVFWIHRAGQQCFPVEARRRER